jgi:hypothetical protein
VIHTAPSALSRSAAVRYNNCIQYIAQRVRQDRQTDRQTGRWTDGLVSEFLMLGMPVNWLLKSNSNSC